MFQIRKFTFNFFQENCYLIWDDSHKCAIIDPGCYTSREKEVLFEFVRNEELTPEVILLTHAHLDHVYGVSACVEKYDIPVYMDAREELTIGGDNKRFASMGLRSPESFQYKAVNEGEKVNVGAQEQQGGGFCARALSTPGHSAGGLCWWFEKEKVLFTGDTLFAGTVGRTDGDNGSLETLQSSLRNTLMQLDGETDIYPGHGPESSIGRERVTNPFIYEDYSLNELLATGRNNME